MGRFRKIFILLLASQAFLAKAGETDIIFLDSFERCEILEPLPAGAIEWDGGGDGTSWDDPLNWAGDAVPVNDDTVFIDLPDTNITVNYHIPNVTTRINNLNSCESISVTSGTLELDGNSRARKNLDISGSGTVTVLNSLTVAFLRQSGGTLNGAGTATLIAPFNWSGGTQSGSGVTIARSGMNLSGTTHFLTSRTLTLNDDSFWTGGAVNLRQSATLNVSNNSLFTIQTDADMINNIVPISTFNIDSGSAVTKTSGGNVTSIAAHFNNNGTVTVSDSELHLGTTNGNGTSTGDFVVDAGTILGIAGTNDMTGASTFTGAGGMVYNNGGTTTINGSYSLGGTLEVKNGTLQFTIALNATDDVAVSGGTLDLTLASSVTGSVVLTSNGRLIAAAALPISGTLDQSNSSILTGAGTVTVTGDFNWMGGTQSGVSGVTIANSGMNLSGTTHFLTSRTLTLNDDSFWTGGAVNLRQSAVINNNAIFDIQTDADMINNIVPRSTLNNTATIQKTAGVGLTTIDATFNDTGTVTVTSGSLNIDGVDY
jgi:hypothetical protein